MLRKYVSKSDLSISVLLKIGKSVHVSFSPLTGGGSIFYTDDEELQEALKNHSKFGRLFQLEDEHIVPDGAQCAGTAIQDGGISEKNGEKESDAVSDNDKKSSNVHVESLEEAKEYLSDHLGISRTKLRSKKHIMEAAAGNGVVFEGI